MATAKKANRIVVTLACTECKERNYTTEKNRKNTQGRMELEKYCLSLPQARPASRDSLSAR